MRLKYQDTVRGKNGYIISSATVTIYLGGTSTLANVYTTATGTSSVNAVTSGTDGSYTFYVDAFEYGTSQTFKAVITKTGYDSYTIDNITVEDVVLGNYTISTAKTVTDSIHIPEGVVLVHSAGGTLTFNGSFSAGSYQVFSGFGTSDIAFGAASVREIFPEWFGAIADGSTDCTSAIRSAIGTAEASIGSVSQDQSGGWHRDRGVMVVTLSFGTYNTTDYIEIPDSIILRGQGKNSTIISSSHDGQIIRNKAMSALYDYRGMEIRDLTIKGSRTLTSQIGIDLLRYVSSAITNVRVRACGSHGIVMRQCISSIVSADIFDCVGDGLWITHGVDDWGMTPNAYPSNANQVNVYARLNDGAGIRVNDSNGNTITGIFEYNYYASGDNVGYNIYIEGTSKQNRFINCWTEGYVDSHVYQNLDNASSDTNIVENLAHYGNGTGGKVNRAVIVNTGILVLINPVSHEDNYKTINGSTAPFQVNVANVGKIMLIGGHHIAQTGNLLIEDENNNKANFAGYANQWFQAPGGSMIMQGGMSHYMDYGQIDYKFYKTTGVASTTYEDYPWCQLNNFTGQLEFGDGTDVPDVGLRRIEGGGPSGYPNGIGPSDGESLLINGDGNLGLFGHVNGAGAQTATLTNSPAAGNPDFWVKIWVNGVYRYIPSWNAP